MNSLARLNIQAHNYGVCSGHAHWHPTDNAGQIESLNPSDESIIARVYNGNAKDLETVITTAQQAQKNWQNIPAPKRGDIIRQLGNKLRELKSELGDLVALEMGKSKQEGDGEVQEMIDMADFAVGLSRQLYGKTMHSERPKHRMYEQWQPLGVVGVISAFNFPVAVWAWNAFIAAICGNTVVWKPSPHTPLCAIAVQHICNEIMLKNNLDGIFSLFISDDNEHANTLINDSRLPLISFTGSSAVGEHVAKTLAGRMGRSILECSGNNAIIIDDTADLKLAIPAVVFGAVGTAGQRCTTTRRLFIHESRYEQVTQALTTAYAKVRIGDPLDTNNLMGPLNNEKAVSHYESAIDQVKKSGGEILYGGNRLKQKGFFVEPTIARAENHWGIVQEETFAPILYVMQYKTLNEAIALQNGVAQGLSSALFTNHLPHAEHFLSCLGSDCGIANINIGTSGAEIGGAFGGEKSTGGGREAGSDSWKAYMRRQTTTINWGPELPLAQGIAFNIE